MGGDKKTVSFLTLAGVMLAAITGFTGPVKHAEAQPNGPSLQPGDLVSDYGASVIVPPPDVSVIADVTLESGGSEELVVETQPDGTVVLSSLGDESVPGGGGGPADCNDDAYHLASIGASHFKWKRTFDWFCLANDPRRGES